MRRSLDFYLKYCNCGRTREVVILNETEREIAGLIYRKVLDLGVDNLESFIREFLLCGLSKLRKR